MVESKRPARRLPRWAWIVIVPLGLLVIVLLALGIPPVAGDPVLTEDEMNVGAVNIEPSWTGLLREWPAPSADVTFSPELAELGYSLFFDPVLSGSNTTACADCHQPDRGFSDGQAHSTNGDGATTRRHAPSLWNVAYTAPYFWDGRAATLEDQFAAALQSEEELNQDPAALLDELAAIPAYAQRFDAIFEDGLTLDNVAEAIAAFERTLISDGAPFDAYAQGDFDALTTQQRRGLGIFRSAGTRCFECHLAPLFTDVTFRVTGVPDPAGDASGDAGGDRGRGEVTGEGDYAFKVPSLRNVVLSAPYMHNGTFATLEEVIDFYSKGGADFTAAEVDRQVRGGFSLSQQEVADLVAFLYALTDETLPDQFRDLSYVDAEGRVIVPDSVPSELTALITPEPNPARETLAAIQAGPRERPECSRDDAAGTVTVGEGQTIQAAVDCAEPGDTVLVPPGVYRERVVIDTSGITLRGLVDEEPAQCPVQTEEALFPSGDDRPAWPVLEGDVDGDGAPDLTDGVIASGNDFRMEYFIVQHYTGNGVLVEGVRGVTLRHLYVEDAGLYGVYPVRSTDVLVECNVATQITDAAIYVGQSRDIVVRHNLAYDNVAGIEIENSTQADVYENEAWNNVGGLLAFMLPNLHSRVSSHIQIHDNYVHDNNRAKGDAIPGSIVSLVPVGSGIFIMATDDSEVFNNRIERNDSFGIALVSLYQAFAPDEIGDVGPLSERNHIHDNQFVENGANPDPEVSAHGLPGSDLLWDAEGYGNLWDEPSASRFPPILPGSGWPEFGQRILYRLWNFVAQNL